jgi:hypothetical protein
MIVRRQDHDHYPFGVVTLTLPQHLGAVPDTTRVERPGEKGIIGRHVRAFASGGNAEAAEVARTHALSEKRGGGTHVY